MKKLLLLLALCAGMTPCFAQYPPAYGTYSGESQSDLLFNNPQPATLRHQFTFRLGGNNFLRMEFSYVNQLQQVTDLDSLIRAVWTSLQPFADSLSKPLVSRRVDYRISTDDVRLRILEHQQKGDVYRIYHNDTSQVKVEQDTLRIIRYTRDSSYTLRRYVHGKPENYFPQQPYVIMLVLNNLSDITRLSSADLHWGLNRLKEELGKNLYNNKGRFVARFAASYDLPSRVKVSPQRESKFSSSERLSVSPYVQSAIQFVRGSWVPSAGLGIELSARISETEFRRYRFYWEPFFYFNRAADGKVTMERNDFISLKYSYSQRSLTTKSVGFSTNLSLSYLRRRRGTNLEHDTFKFALPGLHTKNILLEPEFFFNNFFKNFSPSLKLTLVFD
jgi:hypothetical protein